MHQNQPSDVFRRSDLGIVCRRCRNPMPGTARFCSACGSAAGADVAAELAAVAKQRRQITLVFCDVVDSTGLAEELDPEDLADVIGQFHRAVRDSMRPYGGFVARHMGDGTLTYFGYPEAHEDDAERAVNAALHALSAISALSVRGKSVHAHIGIATGLVVVGDIVGAGELLGVDVAGSTPNLAARLQNLAPQDAILVADTTRRLVGEMYEWRDLGILTLRGIAKPVRAWQVLGQKASASRFEALHGGVLAPLLGREQELATLESAWEDACRGSGRVVLIRGEPGLGKSRLAAQMLDRLRLQSHARLRYFCSLHRRDAPLHPCIQQLEHAAGFAREDDPAQKLLKLERSLPALDERQLQLIAELLLIPTVGRFPVLQLAPHRRRELLMDALLKGVEVIANTEPLVLLFEDAHWSDESSLDLLGRLVERCPKQRILLIVTAWPEVKLPWCRQSHVTELTLSPLENAERTELAKWVADGRRLSNRIFEDIGRRSDGIPLYVEELTQAVIEDAEEKVSSGTVPVSLQASLQARLDRLGAATRDIAQVAACIGREFLAELLSRVVDRSPSELKAALAQLVEASLIVPRSMPDQDGDIYVFRHALLRDVAHETMLGERRRSRHAQIAAALETHFPQRVEAQPDLLAHHWTEAGVPEKAVGYWFLAGIHAMRRSAMAEALVLLQRGLSIVKGLPPGPGTLKRELEFTIALGQAQISTQGYAVAETRRTFERARQLCEGMAAPPPQLLSVLHGLWTHALMTADMQSARSQAIDLLETGKRRNDPIWLLMGHRFCGVTHHPLGAFDEAVAFLRRGVELYDPAMRPTYAPVTVDDPEIVMLTYLSWALMCRGHLGEAQRTSARALEKARGLRQAYSLAHALIGASFVALTIESPEAGLVRLDEALPLMEEHGIAYYGAVGLLFKGWCLGALGEKADAVAILERGMAAYRATGSRLYLSGFLRMTAEAMAQIGEVAHAERCLSESLQLLHATGQRWDEAEIHRACARLHLIKGRTDEALAELETSVRLAAAQGAGLWRLRAACDLAVLRAEQGDRTAARAVLEPVSGEFRDQPELPDIQRARGLVASLL